MVDDDRGRCFLLLFVGPTDSADGDVCLTLANSDGNRDEDGREEKASGKKEFVQVQRTLWLGFIATSSISFWL